MRTTNALIVTDDADFARLLTACWQLERQLPGLSVVTSELWDSGDPVATDLVVVGPLKQQRPSELLSAVAPSTAVILCAPADPNELGALRKRYPRLLHVPLREDWAQVVLLVAGESLRRTEALRLAKQAEQRAAQNANEAVLGRYMTDMKHSINNAMTSLLGNAELLLSNPASFLPNLSCKSRPSTPWLCASTKSCNDSHPSLRKCGALRRLLKLRQKTPLQPSSPAVSTDHPSSIPLIRSYLKI